MPLPFRVSFAFHIAYMRYKDAIKLVLLPNTAPTKLSSVYFNLINALNW